MTSLICVLLASLGPGFDEPPVSSSEFRSLHGSLVPKQRALWETIPWSVDLVAAVDRARREKKPLFMWSMNGHPMGCT
ncbi:MAG: hypothetical protein CMJ83_02780 [Planctomycetes bacterium]|nr:hypothetical protein [Planctomycetota bacterium]